MDLAYTARCLFARGAGNGTSTAHSVGGRVTAAGYAWRRRPTTGACSACDGTAATHRHRTGNRRAPISIPPSCATYVRTLGLRIIVVPDGSRFELDRVGIADVAAWTIGLLWPRSRTRGQGKSQHDTGHKSHTISPHDGQAGAEAGCKVVGTFPEQRRFREMRLYSPTPGAVNRRSCVAHGCIRAGIRV